jgi:hypothetical protein
MKTILLICAYFNIGFAIFHILFWQLFNWKTDLKKLSHANKAIMQLLNIQLTFYFLFMAAMCFIYPDELTTTALGKFILGCTSLFWLLRFIGQFIFLRRNEWKIHISSVLFLTGAILFAIPLLKN